MKLFGKGYCPHMQTNLNVLGIFLTLESRSWLSVEGCQAVPVFNKKVGNENTPT